MINAYLQTTNIRENGFLLIVPHNDKIDETLFDESIIVGYFSNVEKAKNTNNHFYYENHILTLVENSIQTDTGRNSDNSLVITGLDFEKLNELEKDRLIIKCKSFLNISIELIKNEYEKKPISPYNSLYSSNTLKGFEDNLNKDYPSSPNTTTIHSFNSKKTFSICIVFLMIAVLAGATPRILKWLRIKKESTPKIERTTNTQQLSGIQSKKQLQPQLQPKNGIEEFCKKYNLSMDKFNIDRKKESQINEALNTDTYQEKLLNSLDNNNWYLIFFTSNSDSLENFKQFYNESELTPETIIKNRQLGNRISSQLCKLREKIKNNKSKIFSIQPKLEKQYPATKSIYAFFKGLANSSLEGYDENYECTMPFILNRDTEIIEDINTLIKNPSTGLSVFIEDQQTKNKCTLELKSTNNFSNYCIIFENSIKKYVDFIIEDLEKAPTRIGVSSDICNLIINILQETYSIYKLN